jgi:OPA family glycerol-3-phosphate transporter-like MFS transporter
MIAETKRPRYFWLTCFFCWVAYVTAYFGRINLSIGLPYLQEAHGLSKTSLGIVAGGFFTAYAAGQFINGVLGDRFNPRYFVGLGLCCAGLSNVLFSTSHQPWVMFCFWTMNGYFQSMLWGPLMRVIVEVTPNKYLHGATLAFSSSTVLGYFFSYTLVGKMAIRLGWKAAFYIPGAILLIAAMAWVLLLRRYSGGEEASKESGGKAPGGFIPFIIKSGLWLFALTAVLQGSIKESLILWGPAFFSESRSLSIDKALFIMSFVPVMNIAALGANGFVHKCFGRREKHTIVFFLITALLSVFLLRINMSGSLIAMVAAVSVLSASLFAVNNTLTAFVPLNFQKERRVSAAAGILDCAVYIGAAISGPLSGFLADSSGWSGVVNSWIVISCVAILTAAISKNYQKDNGLVR